MDKITIKEVAERAGVSIATVSRVLNGKKVRPTHEERVWASIHELDYSPNPAARQIRGGVVRNFAILVPDLSNDYYAHIANSAIRRARDFQKNMLVFSCDGEQRLERELLMRLSTIPIDALLYCPVSSAEFLNGIEALRKTPIVVFARRSVLPGHPHVYTDNVKGGYIATKYLRRLGRRRILILMGFWREEKQFGSAEQILAALDTPLCGAYSSLDRLEGFRRALAEDDIRLSADMVHLCGYGFRSGYETAKSLFARMIPMDAVIAPNDSVAAGVLQFFAEQHIRVPEEISVVGYDDSNIALMTTPTLTSIRQDVERIGTTAVDLVAKMLAGEAVEDVMVDASLSIRQSTCGTTPREI